MMKELTEKLEMMIEKASDWGWNDYADTKKICLEETKQAILALFQDKQTEIKEVEALKGNSIGICCRQVKMRCAEYDKTSSVCNQCYLAKGKGE